jgi:undecaprenyl-diphosphatase
MDLILLNLLNQTLAHPLLDGLMVGITLIGLSALPAMGVTLLLIKSQRQVGITLLASLVLSLLVTFIFQYLTLRPRPEMVRLVLATPNFPSYPSGHAAMAFGVAAVVSLVYRRWRWSIVAFSGATLIALSRIYLGLHYPSDIFGGAVLGAAVGAACYGLFWLPQPAWRWLLWPQLAIVITVTQIAYLGILPFQFLRWPLADKTLHFLLFGAVVFWLNLWLKGRLIWLGPCPVPVAILLLLIPAIIEEGFQSFFALRTTDLTDLVSDLMGMLFFWWLSNQFIALTEAQR